MMILLFSLLKFFKKKINVLLILETVMIFIILIFKENFKSNNYNNMILILFSVFMVMDSVLGISILIASTRNSSNFMSMNKT